MMVDLIAAIWGMNWNFTNNVSVELQLTMQRKVIDHESYFIINM
jgi:hypothetical protein